MLNYPSSRFPLEMLWQSFLLSFSNLSSLFCLPVEQLENSLSCFSPEMAQFLLLSWFTSLYGWRTSSDNFLNKGLACVHFQSCHMFENVRILSSHFISNQTKIFFLENSEDIAPLCSFFFFLCVHQCLGLYFFYFYFYFFVLFFFFCTSFSFFFFF